MGHFGNGRPVRTAQFLIRPATGADAAGIIAVLNPIILAGIYTVLDTPFDVEAERDFIRGFPPRGIFHVAIEAATDRIVGFQNMDPIATYTHAFDHVGSIGTFVDLTRAREGIATQLFAATWAAAREKGYEKAFTFVRADNPVALAVYRRQGFEIIGTARRHAKLHGRYVDEVLIEKIF